MNCPNCTGAMWKDGMRKGRQAYKCPQCDRRLIEPSQQRKAGRTVGSVKGRVCDLCANPHFSGGLCQMHYRRKVRAKPID